MALMRGKSPSNNVHTPGSTLEERQLAGREISGWHTPFVLGELIILAVGLMLAAIVHIVRGPLPGDTTLILDWQQLVLPHPTITKFFDIISAVNWPNGATIGVVAITVGLLVIRRWLSAFVALIVSSLADATSYLTNQIVQRPRPQAPNLYIKQYINTYYSFPSGHVVHVVAFFGILLFLSFQTRHRHWALWLPRAVLILLIVFIGPSRLLEGEHWPTDILGGILVGGFWLILGIHFYKWARRNWSQHLSNHPKIQALVD